MCNGTLRICIVCQYLYCMSGASNNRLLIIQPQDPFYGAFAASRLQFNKEQVIDRLFRSKKFLDETVLFFPLTMVQPCTRWLFSCDITTHRVQQYLLLVIWKTWFNTEFNHKDMCKGYVNELKGCLYLIHPMKLEVEVKVIDAQRMCVIVYCALIFCTCCSTWYRNSSVIGFMHK